MGNNLRCCLACVLPCGALDVVRIVHLNGHVEEYGRPVHAGKILAANPHHVLSTPCSRGVAARKILIVSPEAELKRGQIYFLIPEAAVPPPPGQKTKPAAAAQRRKQKAITQSESHLSEALPEKKKPPCHRRRRSGRVGTWRPHLDSIAED
ncbi:uncharacterized protein LOC121987739 [Zingiber officinale]|uniref:Uncharacterized protein n=1 Tax=Zingiber officinale TaxID=94328 RepID=A0A8J5GNT5_ZINOF|nr:uncharacterized protein LOC121987739 [Zingiber officinale]KAG6504583.1 hypothetical protein ZIOFF_036917 [Zingiber officinale]